MIFGTVQGDRDQTEIQPRFWVAENAYSPELTGQTLSKPIQFDTAEAATSISPVNVTLTKRAQLLVQLTQALVYLKSKRLDAANTLISSAIAQAENELYFKGEEVLYLLRSTVTRKQKNFDQALQDAQTARQLNPTYARAGSPRATFTTTWWSRRMIGNDTTCWTWQCRAITRPPCR